MFSSTGLTQAYRPDCSCGSYVWSSYSIVHIHRQSWTHLVNSHANRLKEFSVTFMEALQMVHLGVRLWSYVREEASHGRKAPIDPFTRESLSSILQKFYRCIVMMLMLIVPKMSDTAHSHGRRQ